MTPIKRAFNGDTASGLQEWLDDMKDGASYCSDTLHEAMQKAERHKEEIDAMKMN